MYKKIFFIVCIFLMIHGLGIWADGSELYKAVDNNDEETVRLLIEEGIDVNAPIVEMEFATPIYVSVRKGNLAITEFLLEAGAYIDHRALPSIPVSFQWGGNSLLSVALSDLNQEMIDLLLRYDAEKKEISDYYNYKLFRSLSENNAQSLNNVLKNIDIESVDSFLLALCYGHANSETKQVLDDYFVSMGMENPVLIEQLLLLEGKKTEIRGNLPRLEFPLSSSSLKDKNDPRRYTEDKAFDDDLSTSWVEGVEGPGIGQRIAFRLPAEKGSISLLPGYGEEEYFLSNNRLMKAEFSIYFLYTGQTEKAAVYSMKKLRTMNLKLEDRMEYQSFAYSIPQEKVPSAMGELIGVIEIKDIYQGSRWDDTCIAEILVD